MNNNKLLIFLADDYKLIDKYNFKSDNTDLVIMSPFLKLNNSYNEFNKLYYDDYLTDDKKLDIYNFTNKFIWDWFKDENNNDISYIDGLSIGESFVTSIQILIIKSLKLYYSFDVLLKDKSKIFFSDNLSILIKDILIEMCAKKSINYYELKGVNLNKKSNTKGEIINNSELRNQSWLKKYNSIIFIFFSNILIYTQKYKLNNSKYKILTIGSEKLNKSTKGEFSKSILVLKPISKLADLFQYFGKNHFIYVLHKKKKYHNSIRSLNLKIISNISKRYNLGNTSILKNVIEKEILVYSEDLYNHYLAYNSLIKTLRPDASIVTGETHELYQSVTRAAKQNNVKVILTSHGFSDFGYKEFKSGNSKLFDGVLAYGQDQYENYIKQGFKSYEIEKSVFPYFKNFLPKKEIITSKRYKNALVLFPEPNNLCSGYTLQAIDNYFYNIISVLKRLDIKIIGFKSRFNNHSEIKNNTNYLTFNKKKYFHYFGYNQLIKYIKNVDLVIGPLCSAMYEVFLEGKEYYSFQSEDISKFTPNYRDSIYDFIHISSNKNELFENIKDRKLFKKNYSINELTFINEINCKSQIFEKYYSSILKLNSNNYEKQT